MEPRDYEELYENLKSSFVIRNKEEVKKIADFLNKSDYEFYNEIREETTEEEFEKFCQEFPEARIVFLYFKNQHTVLFCLVWSGTF